MTDCLVTLAIARGVSDPYASDHIKVASAAEYTAGVYLVTTAYEQIPLTNPPGVVPFPQGEVFAVLEPGTTVPKFLLIPSTPTANYDDLEVVVLTVDPPGFLGDVLMTNVLDNVDTTFRKEIDVLFSETVAGTVTGAAVGALINNNADTKDALGDEAADDTSPLAASIDARGLAHFIPAVVVLGTHNGTVDNTADLAAADVAAIAAGTEVLLHPGIYKVTSDLTITSPVRLLPGAVIKPASGKTVTLAGGCEAPRKQVFDHSAGGVVVPAKVDWYHPAWWGAVGTSDDSVTWTAMLAANAKLVTATSFGARVLVPQGDNKIWNIALASIHLEASHGACRVSVAGSHSSGFMLQVGAQVTINGGEYHSNGNAGVTVIDYTGARSHITNAYIRPVGAGTIGVNAHTASGSITPRMSNCIVYSGDAAIGSSTGIGIILGSSDGELTNVWVGNLNTGITVTGTAATLTGCHVWGTTGAGVTGTDSSRYIGCYFETCGSWGLDLQAADSNIISGCHFTKNGLNTAAGGLRIQTSSASCNGNTISDITLDDNTGVGLLLDGDQHTRGDGIQIISASVRGGGAALCTTGVQVTAATFNAVLDVSGKPGDVLTALLANSSVSSSVTFGDVRKLSASSVSLGPSSTAYTVLQSMAIKKKERYSFRGFLIVDGPQSADLKFRVQGTSLSTLTGWFGIGSQAQNSNASTTAASINPITAVAAAISGGGGCTLGLVGTGSMQVIPFFGYVDATSSTTDGTIEVQAGPLTSDPTAITVSLSEVAFTRIG